MEKAWRNGGPYPMQAVRGRSHWVVEQTLKDGRYADYEAVPVLVKAKRCALQAEHYGTGWLQVLIGRALQGLGRAA